MSDGETLPKLEKLAICQDARSRRFSPTFPALHNYETGGLTLEIRTVHKSCYDPMDNVAGNICRKATMAFK